MKLGQLWVEISKAYLPVSANLSNDFKSIILETDQRKISPFMRLFWEEQQKYLQSSQNNATYHSTLILMLHIRQPIYLVLTNILSPSFLMFHIHLIKLELHNSGKGTRYSIHMEQWYVHTLELHFCYFLWRQRMLVTNLSKTAHFCSLMDWFLTSQTFKITSLLNLNKIQC